MVLGSIKKQAWVSHQSRSDRADTTVVTGRKSMPWLMLCLAVSSVVAIAPSALSQSATPTVSETASQQALCMNDPQGLMCHSANPASEPVIASPTAVSSTPAASSQRHASELHSFELISAEQMERLSGVLLGLLYFVLPAGFGLGLFLHDRHQQYRAAMLEAQIQLLEKLWKQSPQAE